MTTKITTMTQDTSPGLDSLIETAKDPSGTPLTRSVSIEDILALAPTVQLVDRGDVSAWDWSVGNFTADNAWHDLDCSSIVPAGATWIMFRVDVSDNTVGSHFALRKNGSAQTANAQIIRTQVANFDMDNVMLVPCDTNRVVEYRAGAFTFQNLNLAILGWVIGSNDASYEDITIESGGTAASLLYRTTFVTTNGDSDLDNLTLADGTIGQIKEIACVAEGNAADTWKITPANMLGGTQITFSGVGEGCILRFHTNGWAVIGNNGGTIS